MPMELIRVAKQVINDKASQKFAQECGITYPLFFDNEVIKIYVASLKDARSLCWKKYYLLAKQCLSWNQEKIEIYFPPYDINPITINPHIVLEKYHDRLDKDINMISSTMTTAAIQISQLKLSPALLPTILRWMENPQIKGGIVRIEDERQIVLTHASSTLVSGIDLAGATQRKRSDYWYLPDLEALRRETIQRGDAPFEFRWRGTNEQGSRWMLFVNRYSKICDEFGQVYQISENVGSELIASPSAIQL